MSNPPPATRDAIIAQTEAEIAAWLADHEPLLAEAILDGSYKGKRPIMADTTPVFVFGSNLAGRHGKGAALHALKHCGAVYGRGRGRQGDSYAIPTKDHYLRTLALDIVAQHVALFLRHAAANPDTPFQLTPIGCGLAGYRRAQIELMFVGAPANVLWPPEWRPTDETSDSP